LSRFHVSYREKDLGEFTLHVPGVHNVLNATAAIAVGVGLDVGMDEIRAALEQFRGVDRRFHLRGRVAGVSVIDDYGHHPTEIKATLAAARQCGFRKIHVVFQPHRYTRTRDLIEEFATAFDDADTLFVLDIYAASEKPIEGISGEALARTIHEKSGRSADYVSSFADVVSAAAAVAEDGDMILTLGAGSVSQLGPTILEKLKDRAGVVGN
jgi:UDP-N-acetylmuramate--alanine ligase